MNARFTPPCAVMLVVVACAKPAETTLPGTGHVAEPPPPRDEQTERDHLSSPEARTASRVRGLPFRTRTQEHLLDPATFSQVFAAETHWGATKGRAALQLVLALATSRASPAQRTSDDIVAADSYAAFYSPRQGALYRRRGEASPAQRRSTLIHEYTHALQSQHFGLAARLDPFANTSDQLDAVLALAEGDATLAEALAAEAPLELAPLNHSAPLFERARSAPYRVGAAAVVAAYERGGWPAINDAWRMPTLTSEQLLHPRKLTSYEGWRRLPTLPPVDCRLDHSDVLGELALLLVLMEWLPLDAAHEAAAGWHGDRLSTFICSGEPSPVQRWELAFDNVEDLEEAEAAFSSMPQRADVQLRRCTSTLCISVGGARDVCSPCAQSVHTGQARTSVSTAAPWTSAQ